MDLTEASDLCHLGNVQSQTLNQDEADLSWPWCGVLNKANVFHPSIIHVVEQRPEFGDAGFRSDCSSGHISSTSRQWPPLSMSLMLSRLQGTRQMARHSIPSQCFPNFIEWTASPKSADDTDLSVTRDIYSWSRIKPGHTIKAIAPSKKPTLLERVWLWATLHDFRSFYPPFCAEALGTATAIQETCFHTTKYVLDMFLEGVQVQRERHQDKRAPTHLHTGVVYSVLREGPDWNSSVVILVGTVWNSRLRLLQAPDNGALVMIPSLPCQFRALIPYQFRALIPYQFRALIPYQPRNVIPYQSRNVIPYQIRTLIPYQIRTLIPYQIRTLIPYQSRNLIPYAFRALIPYQSTLIHSYQSRALIYPLDTISNQDLINSGPWYHIHSGPWYHIHSGPWYHINSGPWYHIHSGPWYHIHSGVYSSLVKPTTGCRCHPPTPGHLEVNTVVYDLYWL